MTANPASLHSLLFEAESSAANWAEGTSTFANRVPLVAPVELALTHPMVPSEQVNQRRQEGGKHVLMIQGGSFTTTIDWFGHGSTMVGSPTVHDTETLLGIVFGNVALSLTTSDTLTGGTASAPTTTGASGVSPGGLVRIGTGGISADGDGNGQGYPSSGHASNTLTMLVDLDGAPANGQVLYPVVQFYPSTSPTSTAVVGTRFRFLSGNYQYDCHGCYPTAVTITGLNPGQRPQFQITWGVSRWTYANATFPTTVTETRAVPAPIAAGSLHVQTPGTTTRNKIKCRAFSIDWTIGHEVEHGDGGVSVHQTISGVRRTGDMIKVSFTADADATTTTPVIPGWFTANTAKSIMWTGSCTDGSAVMAWFPNVCPSDGVPVQVADQNLNRVVFTGTAYNSSTTTSDLTLAAVILGSA